MPNMPPIVNKELTYVAGGESNVATIVIPALGKLGDLAILCDSPRNQPASDPGTTVPAGWAAAGNYYSNGTRMIVSWKVLSASDPGATITGGAGNLNQRKTIAVYRPTRPILGVSVAGLLETYSVGDLIAQSVLATDMVLPSIALCHTRGDGSYLTVSSPAAVKVSTSGFQELIYNIFNKTAANQSFDMPDSGTVNFCQSMAINVNLK